MNFVKVGSSGLKITELTFGSALTIGTENSDYSFAEDLISTAWNLGIRSFDTSNNYGFGEAERLLGKVLSKYPREEYVLATKGSWPLGDSPYLRGLSRKHILWAFDESIKRLNVDYVDLYYAHRFDPEVPMEEIVRTFNLLINEGKIRYWATSEWPLEALKKCFEICDKFNMERPITEQFIYSYALQKSVNNGVYKFCHDEGMGTLCFSPLCQGFLTGKYKNGIPDDSRIAKADKLKYNKTINFYNQNKENIDHFLSITEKYNVDPVAAALQWCIRKQIYPVFGASKVSQLEHNIKSIENKIPEEFWGEL